MYFCKVHIATTTTTKKVRYDLIFMLLDDIFVVGIEEG